MNKFPFCLLQLLNFLVIWSVLNSSVQSQCLVDNSTCHEDGSFGWCCSTFCLRLSGVPTGCCQVKGEPRPCPRIPNEEQKQQKPNLETDKQQKPHLESEKQQKRNSESASSPNGILIGFGVVVSIAILMLALGLIILWRKRLTTQQLKRLTAEEVEDFWNGKKAYHSETPLLTSSVTTQEQSSISSVGVETALALPFDRRYKVSRDDLKIDKSVILGKGQFGVVLRGQLKNQTVAVKTTKPNTDVSYLKALLNELKLMVYIDKHENIIEFLGACAEQLQDNVIYVVVEFCPLGDLLSFLKKNRENFVGSHGNATEESLMYENVEKKSTITTTNFLNWSTQISNGMAHLERKKVVHADLAARNILMFHNDIVKISDFGLSRQILNYSNYTKKSKGPVPWRWLSLESLRYMEFTSKSDVWSYAVLLWEIFTLGQLPFPNHVWDQKFVNLLISGQRMEKPEHATEEIYTKMLECWDQNPDKRPNFQALQQFFNHHYRNQFYVQLP